MRKAISSIFIVTLMVFGFVTTTPAEGQEVKRSVTINRDTTVGGQAVSKGNYTLKFNETQDGEVILIKGSKEVAKVNYKMTKITKAPSESLVVYTLASDGKYTVKRIELKGSEMALSFE
jgi:hypothetical protein